MELAFVHNLDKVGNAPRGAGNGVVMLDEYLPILLFLAVATVVGVALLVLGSLLGPQRPESDKLSPTNAASRHSRTRTCSSTCAIT